MTTESIGMQRPKRLRRLLPAALFAAPIAFTGFVLVNPATACAEPAWDVGEYDSCSRNFPPGTDHTVESWTEHMKWCCFKSGGVWNTTTQDCGAPPIQGPPGGQPGPVVTPGQVEDPATPASPRPSVPSGGIFAPA
jgi:hypothetical protein